MVRLIHHKADRSLLSAEKIVNMRCAATCGCHRKKSDVLLCDEPTEALYFKTGRVVLEAINTVNATLGTTTIVITHNAAIAGMADRVIEMRDGMIVSDRVNKRRKAVSELSW